MRWWSARCWGHGGYLVVRPAPAHGAAVPARFNSLHTATLMEGTVGGGGVGKERAREEGLHPMNVGWLLTNVGWLLNKCWLDTWRMLACYWDECLLATETNVGWLLRQMLAGYEQMLAGYWRMLAGYWDKCWLATGLNTCLIYMSPQPIWISLFWKKYLSNIGLQCLYLKYLSKTNLFF